MDNSVGVIIGAIFFIALGLFVYLSVLEEKEWKAFMVSHECKKVGEIAPSTSTGFGVSNNGSVSFVPISNPGKNGYACNDGVTYWR